VELPETFIAILANEVFLRQLFPKTLAALESSKLVMLKETQSINNKQLPNRRIKELVDLYGKELYYAQQVLVAETLFMRHEVNEAQLEQMNESFLMEKVGLTPEKLQKALENPATKPLDWGTLGKDVPTPVPASSPAAFAIPGESPSRSANPTP